MPLSDSRPFLAVSIAVLTVSDTRTLDNDTSGATLAERVVKAGHTLAARAIEKDDAGAIGPETLTGVALSDTVTLLDSLTAAQRANYRQMAAFGLFGTSWLARLDRRRAAALDRMALAEPLSRR